MLVTLCDNCGDSSTKGAIFTGLMHREIRDCKSGGKVLASVQVTLHYPYGNKDICSKCILAVLKNIVEG